MIEHIKSRIWTSFLLHWSSAVAYKVILCLIQIIEVSVPGLPSILAKTRDGIICAPAMRETFHRGASVPRNVKLPQLGALQSMSSIEV